ncbi:MAG: DNA repair protein RecO [Oscillospiraceae bacterium]|nr:DNA repair protein RecO [Oscillospiraceae bacterium]
MTYLNTTGVVLREVAYKDSAKILTVLTSTEGKLTVSAYGSGRKNSKLAVSTGLLVFSHMTLTRRGERWTLKEAEPIEQFLGLREELKLLSLASYIAELTEAISDEDSLNTQLLPLMLNSIYALSEKVRPANFVKPVFELRLMAISGFEPILEKPKAEGGFETKEGILTLDGKALEAAKYILTCNPKKLFSFKLSDNSINELASATENYLLTHLDRTFKTLDYYKKVLDF